MPCQTPQISPIAHKICDRRKKHFIMHTHTVEEVEKEKEKERGLKDSDPD